MIDYKSAPSNGTTIIQEQVPSPNLDGTISLTWLWETIIRTKRLPDDLEPKVLFIVLRDRLRNPEREVRQHALRVLADLIPIIEQNLDQHLEFLLPDLVSNLSHVAPSVRKGTVDVLRIYLRHTSHPNEMLKKFMTAVPEDSHLMQGLIMAIPYFANQQITEDTQAFLLRQLFLGMAHDFLREASLASLVRTRSKIGIDTFNKLLGPDKVNEFHAICNHNNIILESEEKLDDNVILQTEITLETGPAITMKIHEESTTTTSNEMQMTDSESELVTRSPRKVHFGGEVVKMRTPESDSNHQSSDDNDMQTSVIIDRPTSIKITVSDGVTAIKTRHKSMIPVRITTGGSNPSTPRKRIKSKRLHKSAPELSRASKIPLPHQRSTKKIKERQLRHSRGEAEFSPIPIHNEIEVFHNLTRSPERSKVDVENNSPIYSSFQVCKEDVKEEISKEMNSTLMDVIAVELMQKEDTWARSRALDDLIYFLRKNSTIQEANSVPKLLEALFSCTSQPRLQLKAEEALNLVIDKISHQTLQQLFRQLCNDIIKLRPPSGVRLALLIMRRSSPRIFFENVHVEPSIRESILQALIAAARTFPSSEINLVQGTRLAFEALQDDKRAVKQAALETLASLAQVAGNSMILESINEFSREVEDSQELLRVVRTRLSRRQLPTVDLNGSVRYSSPREQEELDWLCGGIPSLTKSISLNTIKVPMNNYWKHNSRHDTDQSSINDEGGNGSKEQIWTIDASTFPKIEKAAFDKAALCPVYLLHRNRPQINGKTYKNFDRGRSNSPPSKRQDSHLGGQRFFRQQEQFRKSFSSEHIYSKSSLQEVSSRSSTTSTGSSRSGLWLRDFRSGIPIPIGADSKLKLRGNRQNSDFLSGPLLAQEPIRRTTIASSQGSPEMKKSPLLHPPPSTDSESSGYFTPPAEHHLKDSAQERFSNMQTFEENNNVEEPNFQVIDSETSVEPDISRQSSVSFEENEVDNAEQISTESHEEEKRYTPLDDVDFNANPRTFNKSRSEANLKHTLPEISGRKSVNSAPPLNDIVTLVPYNYVETPQSSPVKISLPGSITSNNNSPAKNQDDLPPRIMRRSIKLRSSKHNIKSPNTVESRPKDVLNQSLTQMESGDWETIMQGLNSLIRLSHSHPDVLEPHLHPICVALAKNIKNLRSQVARSACHASSEIFNSCKRGLDMEFEELAGPLLQRTADTNKFLRSDANAALDAMSLNLSIPRVVAVITNKGSTHQNCIVRAAATRLLSDIAMRLGAEKVFQLPKETRDKFLFVGANGLTEGSLETRKFAKTLMTTLVRHHQFQKALLEAVPQQTLRHISKAISSLK